MPHYPHGKEKTDSKGYTKKEKRTMVVFNPKNFIGRGATSEDSGVAPNEHRSIGFNYGIASKNAMGQMRSDSIGYIPVSRAKLGTPPTSVV